MRRNFHFLMKRCAALFVMAVLATGAHVFAEGDSAEEIDVARQLSAMVDSIPPYHPHEGVTGKALLSGSATMQQLGAEWASKFKLYHPTVEFTRGADTSKAALEALKNDPTAIVGIGRMIGTKEVDELRHGKCKDPAVVIVGLDPVAVLVNEKNPLQSVSPEQLQTLFGKSDVPAVWGQAGVTGELAKTQVRIHGRGEQNTTQNFIESTILNGKPAAAPAVTHKTAGDLQQELANDPAGIGLGRIGTYPGLKLLALEINGKFIVPSGKTFMAGEYPLVRPLTLVFDKSLLDNDNGLRREILSYVLSRQGQEEVMRANYFPINPNFIAHQMASFSKSQLR